MQDRTPETLSIQTHGKCLGGRPKGAWSKCSPKVRNQIARLYLTRVPVSTIARQVKISRGYVYVILKEMKISLRN